MQFISVTILYIHTLIGNCLQHDQRDSEKFLLSDSTIQLQVCAVMSLITYIELKNLLAVFVWCLKINKGWKSVLSTLYGICFNYLLLFRQLLLFKIHHWVGEGIDDTTCWAVNVVTFSQILLTMKMKRHK